MSHADFHLAMSICEKSRDWMVQTANTTLATSTEQVMSPFPWSLALQLIVVFGLAAWFVYFLIQININPIGRIPPAYVVKGPVALDIGGSNAKIVYFRPPKIPANLQMPKFARKDATDFVPVPKHMNFFSQAALSEYSQDDDALCGTLSFIKMPTRRVGQFAEFIQKNDLHKRYNARHLRQLNATGGGAFKYGPMIRSMLGITLVPKAEMECLIRGLNFLLHTKPDEVFTVDLQTKERLVVKLDRVFPYLVVNVGSGISILKVTGQNKFQRISGTSVGGGTFWGLAKLLTDVRSWDDINDLTLHDGPGDNKMVDLLVGDIYGGRDIPDIGLSRDVIASSFGKAATCDDSTSEYSSSSDDDMRQKEKRTFVACENLSKTSISTTNLVSLETDALQKAQAAPSTLKKRRARSTAQREADADVDTDDSCPPQPQRPPRVRSSKPKQDSCSLREGRVRKFKSQDIVKSLFYMISNNIGQIAFLNAKLHQCNRIFFCGGFVQDNPYVWTRLTYAIQFWSKAEMQALFLTHDGYLGALGALLSE
eukprot:GGOE01007007.1.p1 GENE.GGOE01007007.1~~GGOE01007007.1.p1  ORF type:complete len:538 (-),score=148.14 GGOE01007007.1:1461-3074(-)